MAQATTLFPLDAPPVPLRRIEDGTIRIGDTRIPLERVVYGFNQGESAESIVESFPVLELSDVYAVIAFYLKHRDAVDAYVEKQRKDGDRVQREIESQPDYKEWRERIRKRAAELRSR